MSVEFLAVDLGHLDTLELGNVLAFLLGKSTTLPVGDIRALGSWNILALFLFHSLTLPLLNILAFLHRNVLTVLGNHITALLGVVDLFTHLPGHGAALLGVDSLALLAINILKEKLIEKSSRREEGRV